MSQDQSPAQSPTAAKPQPKPSNAMDFPGAIREVTNGKAVTKLEWDNPKIYVKLVSEKLMIMMEDGLYHPLILNLGDLTGEDWVVISNQV